MRLVRQIIFILAALSLFIYLSIFSAFEYNEKNIDLETTSDRLPAAKEVIGGISHLVAIIEKMPMLRLIPPSDDIINYQAKLGEMLPGDNADEFSSDLVNTKIIESSGPNLENFSYQNSISEVQKTNWSDLFKRLKERLFSNWFSS